MWRHLFPGALLAVPGLAQAHAFWLEPADFQVDRGEQVDVDFRVGEDAAHWGVYWERVAAFRSHGARDVTDHQASLVLTTPERPGGAKVELATPGTHVLAFESLPSFSDLPADRFDAYVAGEGLTAIAAHRAGTEAGNGTEQYSRRAKTLLQVGRKPTDNATRPIGQILELVPLDNPFAQRKGGPIRLAVLWRGEPLQGATVRMVDLDEHGTPKATTTDAAGVVTYTLPATGRWLFDVIWGVPSPMDDRADYLTMFSSLTFGRTDG
jgi:hypothetical protein